MDILKPFVLEDFDLKKPFSSFLPGLAGVNGIPLWTYYANRGQGVTSVGSKDKNGAIIEFNPACISYEKVNTQGFRTFIRVNDTLIEAFAPRIKKNHLKRIMETTGASFKIIEVNEEVGYSLEIEYFGLPNMPLGALTRRLKLTALKDLDLELIDGSTQVLPQGISNGAYKDCGNLMRSWMDVYYLENKTPFFTMRASSADEAEVEEVTSGNFYLAKYNNELLDVICDLEMLFGHDTSRTYPIVLESKSFKDLLKEKQYVVNKIPCAFVGVSKNIKKNEVLQIDTLLGYLPKYELLIHHIEEILEDNFFTKKEQEAKALVKDLTDDVLTETAYPLFDEYIRQSYLDNFLRGGYPVNLGSKDKPIPYYIYSRKHGDPERDYNWFNLEPEYYSQGNGNFRDVNQNRRSDVIFNNFIGSKNIKLFMNLISLDGNNPLVINGSTFTLNEDISKEDISIKVIGRIDKNFINLLSYHFTPGGIINYLIKNNYKSLLTDTEIFDLILNNSKEHLQAVFGEGYWIDHFTYNLDLIESYLWIYPDKEEELVFDDSTYSYFYNPVYVLPRSEKIGKTKKGAIRQYGSTKEISQDEKIKIGYNPYSSNWAKTKDGNIYNVNLASKLISLITTKFASRDPFGYGLNMDANKPGWNDAMNGLPGLLASGVSESIEVLRLIDYTHSVFKKYPNKSFSIPLSLDKVLKTINKSLKELENNSIDQATYYDIIQTALEDYRLDVRLGVVDSEVIYITADVIESLLLMKNEFEKKLKELEEKFKILPTYISYDVTQYDELDEKTPYGLTKIKVRKYELVPVPAFLEAPARYLKTNKMSKEESAKLYQEIKTTGMYDEKLKIYRTSVDLDNESLEIGRIRAFTKGWLERESDFMHMTFKYLYGLLKSHLYDEFFNEIKNNFPAFMDKEVYGRSVFENSSFIATSVNPNPNIHGNGFVARLSGSNTEVVSMWLVMMFGYEPFTLSEDGIHLTLKPVIPIDYFKDGIVKAKFLQSIDVTYVNLTGKSTYEGLVPVKYELSDGTNIKVIEKETLDHQTTIDVRNKLYSHIKVYLGNNKF